MMTALGDGDDSDDTAGDGEDSDDSTNENSASGQTPSDT